LLHFLYSDALAPQSRGIATSLNNLEKQFFEIFRDTHKMVLAFCFSFWQRFHASWKVLDFFLENSSSWKVPENHFGPGRSWKLKLKILKKYP